MKKVISILLAIFLFIGCFSMVSAANETPSKKQITIRYSGKIFNANVFCDEDGILYAPIDWMTYFGLYDCKESEEDYVFFPVGQDKNHEFAKRIYISKDGKYYALSYYTDVEGLYKNQLIYQDSDFSKKMLHYLNTQYPGTASYQPVFSGVFSNSFVEEETLYLPLAEMLPFFNAKIGITNNNQELYISPNPMSLSQAMYNIDIADLAFNASTDMEGAGALSFASYIIDTFNIVNPRLDRISSFEKGKENDYKTIFKDYLIDNKVYLSAFDEDISPSSEALELGKDLVSVGKTGLSIVSNANKIEEYILGVKELSIQAKSFSEVCSDFAEVGESDIIGGAYKMFDYWYNYTNQVEDHRKMLGAVYNYYPQFKAVGLPSYRAATETQKLYGEQDSVRLLAATATAMENITMDFLETAVNAQFKHVFMPYKASYEIAKLIPEFKEAVDQIENISLLYVIDESASLATNSYFDMRYSNQYDIEFLENLRLCAMLSLISSKHAYVSLWGEDYNYPKVEKIDEALKKLYLAADGVACDSSDYYTKKRSELEENLKELKIEEGWSENKFPMHFTDYLGMTVDEIAAIWGEDYEETTIQHGVFVMYYKDNRTPWQFTYVSTDENPSKTVSEITIGKEDDVVRIIGNLTNQETYHSIKKQHSAAVLEEQVFSGIRCNLVANGFSFHYVWTTSNPHSDSADYVGVSINMQNGAAEPEKDKTESDAAPPIDKPSYLTDYINMTLSDIKLIWGTDHILVSGGRYDYSDHRIPFNFNIKKDETISALFVDVSLLEKPGEKITKDLMGTETLDILQSKYPNGKLEHYGVNGKIFSILYNDIQIAYRWEHSNWEGDPADTVVISIP